MPVGLIKKQYGESITMEEVNKVLQSALNEHISKEKLDILGNPLPKPQDNISWDADEFTFEFELGLSPKFDVDFSVCEDVVKYDIIIDDKIVNDQLDSIQKQFSSSDEIAAVAEVCSITGIFTNEEEELTSEFTFELSDIKGKVNNKKFLGKKLGSKFALKTKNLFEDSTKLVQMLNKEDGATADFPLELEITKIFSSTPAELNAELFAKVFPEDNIEDLDGFKARLKEDAKKYFDQQSDQYLLNAISKTLMEKTKFELPSDFLKRWIQVSGEKVRNEAEAKEEFEKSEDGFRYQLIESKILADSKIEVSYEDIKTQMTIELDKQMSMYGQALPQDKIEEFTNMMMQNKEEFAKIKNNLQGDKLLAYYKENIKFTQKEVDFETFAKEAFPQQDNK